MRLLVVGAAPDSLGAAVAEEAKKVVPGQRLNEVITAGIGLENQIMDVTGFNDVWDALLAIKPTHIVVTTGINVGDEIGQGDYSEFLRKSLMVNTVGVMNVLDVWIALRADSEIESPTAFVAISSNSAHIARRNSAPYCASKAALSMAMRCAARELAGSPLVYGYEFGLLAGTPMTQITEARFGPAQTRMPGAEKGLNVRDAASAIVGNLLHPWQGLNGAMLRLDAGEQ